MWLLIGLVIWPLIEIALFVTLGSAIGLGLTLVVVVGTAALGVAILRGRGMRSFGQLRQNVTLQPQQPLGEGLLTMFAAVLLILPGFLTDALGLLLLVPPIQRLVLNQISVELRSAGVNLMGRMVASRMMRPHAAAAETDGTVIDGEFREVEGGKRPAHPPSGWTRH